MLLRDQAFDRAPAAPAHFLYTGQYWPQKVKQQRLKQILCIQVAMSLPGDRDAQRMLMGEQPLSMGRPLRPPNSSRAGRSGQRLSRRSDSMPQALSTSRHLERKADPGIGVQPF
jgi:hypothetical protein